MTRLHPSASSPRKAARPETRVAYEEFVGDLGDLARDLADGIRTLEVENRDLRGQLEKLVAAVGEAPVQAGDQPFEAWLQGLAAELEARLQKAGRPDSAVGDGRSLQALASLVALLRSGHADGTAAGDARVEGAVAPSAPDPAPEARDLTAEAVLAGPVASVPEHRVRARAATPTVARALPPRPLPHLYEPRWSERHFGWFYAFFAGLDVDRFARGVDAIGGRMEEGLGHLLAPLDRALSRLGRWVRRVTEPVGQAVGMAFAPLAGTMVSVERLFRSISDAVSSGVGRALAVVPVPAPLQRLLWLGVEPSTDPDAPALQATVKDRYEAMLWLSVIVSVGFHAAVFAFSPTLEAEDFSFVAEELVAVDIPPELDIPPPPQRIARPATPVIAAGVIDEDITIAATTFEDNPVDELPPPPETVTASGPEAEPTFTPFTVAPRVLNASEVIAILDAEYPRALRDTGIGGTVIVWFYIDEGGRVTDTRLFQSSGFEPLDQAALRVATQIEFSPALNRDRATPVWIQLPLEFRVR